jgi:hypothetical protein
MVVGLSLAAASSFAADARTVSVVNETGYAIKFLGFNARMMTNSSFASAGGFVIRSRVRTTVRPFPR